MQCADLVYISKIIFSFFQTKETCSDILCYILKVILLVTLGLSCFLFAHLYGVLPLALLITISVVLSCLIYDKVIKKKNRILEEKAKREKVNTNLAVKNENDWWVESGGPSISNEGTLYRDAPRDQKSGVAGSNAARRRCPAAPSDLPKSGGAAAPPAPRFQHAQNNFVIRKTF